MLENKSWLRPGAALCINTGAAVGIIFVNKFILTVAGFGFVATLTALHFVATALYSTRKTSLARALPTFDIVWFTLATDVSVVFMNLSLRLNTVGFYQISKICLIPASCFLEVLLFKRRFPLAVVISICVVLSGVWIATVSDIRIQVVGLVAAATAIVSSALHQVGIAHLKEKHSLASDDFLALTAPWQAVSMILIGPVMDKIMTGKWCWTWFASQLSHIETGGAWIVLSISFAVAINASQIICISNFSAVGSQVLGHLKTVLVLAIAWVLYEPAADMSRTRQILGAIIAMTGILAYGHLTTQAQNSKSLALVQNETLEVCGLEAVCASALPTVDTARNQT